MAAADSTLSVDRLTATRPDVLGAAVSLEAEARRNGRTSRLAMHAVVSGAERNAGDNWFIVSLHGTCHNEKSYDHAHRKWPSDFNCEVCAVKALNFKPLKRLSKGVLMQFK